MDLPLFSLLLHHTAYLPTVSLSTPNTPSLFLELLHPLIHELWAYKEKKKKENPLKGLCHQLKIFFSNPLFAWRVCAFVAGGGQTRRAYRGMGGQYFGRREK
jgi:hypothetical protein